MEKTFMRIAIVLAFLAAAHAFAWTNSQDAGVLLGASAVKEMTFEKNSPYLSDVQKSELKAAIDDATKSGSIAEIKILAWSDKEYPAVKGQQDRQDVKLARRRISDIKSYLKSLKVAKVGGYNMTERPTAIQKFFHTKTETVKKTTEIAGAAPTADQTGIFDDKAQASKSLVMIFMKK